MKRLFFIEKKWMDLITRAGPLDKESLAVAVHNRKHRVVLLSSFDIACDLFLTTGVVTLKNNCRLKNRTVLSQENF